MTIMRLNRLEIFQTFLKIVTKQCGCCTRYGSICMFIRVFVVNKYPDEVFQNRLLREISTHFRIRDFERENSMDEHKLWDDFQTSVVQSLKFDNR